ncbi:neurotransmitter:Na+ symporter, NSS family [Dethiosulfatibacter aminovorans DSM 17477]|uniref:Transporter n=1 Tax=Dethiosulfatibacter aminovorans DSM 17477 TaxID=1121476 RepID=A0A1M6I3W6_9FIRM|nr:sodium-dependent transporter [Dethiosulfatibacter aminovorans]SHJ29143.1 neurotransmitter:Na+ symporter, NSS family [Dethiosulfatibacter aminovorans DSM 17477]
MNTVKIQEPQKRDHWGSKIGFIMAAAGSAVGLGNIWKFPYTAGENGGGAFVFIYLIFIVLIGFSVMLTEFALGRRRQLAAVGAFKSEDRRWTFVGIIGVLSGFLIMGFYPVVGGWALAYIFKVTGGLLNTPELIGSTFEGFITNPVIPLVWMVAYLVMNIAIVSKGISSGIEKAGKVLMPLLFVILIIIALKGLTLPNSFEGVKFLFKPDFSKMTGKVVLAALGQAFFSLSLGMGCMITYGSYLEKKENLVSTTGVITAMDTGVALLAGLAMFPAMFAFGIAPTEGPGLVFVVVPALFAEMGGLGTIFATLFFVALTVAALTSSVSLLEVVTSYLIDEKKFTRMRAVVSASSVMVVLCILSSLSLGGLGPQLFGKGAFDVFDLLTDKIFLALGGMLICIFAGWRIKKEDLFNEITNGGTLKYGFLNFWYLLVKYVIPVTILVVAVNGILEGFQTGAGPVMLIGIGLMAFLASVSKKL